MSLRPSVTGAQDSYVWYPVASGSYSAKSGYAAASASLLPTMNQPVVPTTFNWHKSVWNVESPPKLKLLIWKIFHEALPTGLNLQK
ncbi:hypothetical protein F2Q68_00024815 [Brassica cretica]|uniref:Reverse transcriptase zinc-binding domain-containing protein n=1 Tax=Brassica cretica TaxID=69181 RepID=A0A8S9ID98_BRACR|nr:hypothetical protein F2Q68_00024815 [Brassica cretica]